MGIFSKTEELYAPVTGEVKSISDTSDEMFASKAMGDGFMVKPESNDIYSPVVGRVISVFPTKHAISIKKGKHEYLLHLGIDTVELNGKGFDIKVSANDSVDQNTLLGTVDFDFVKDQGKATDVIFVCTNLNDKQNIDLEKLGRINHSDSIGFIK